MRKRGRSAGRGLRPRLLGSGFSPFGRPVSGTADAWVASASPSSSLPTFFGRRLLGFVEDAVLHFFAARCVTTCPLQAQLFLKRDNHQGELVVLCSLKRCDLGGLGQATDLSRSTGGGRPRRIVISESNIGESASSRSAHAAIVPLWMAMYRSKVDAIQQPVQLLRCQRQHRLLAPSARKTDLPRDA